MISSSCFAHPPGPPDEILQRRPVFAQQPMDGSVHVKVQRGQIFFLKKIPDGLVEAYRIPIGREIGTQVLLLVKFQHKIHRLGELLLVISPEQHYIFRAVFYPPQHFISVFSPVNAVPRQNQPIGGGKSDFRKHFLKFLVTSVNVAHHINTHDASFRSFRFTLELFALKL